MSIHKSLKVRAVGVRHRSVLTRFERLLQLGNEEKWKDGESIFGLPKVKVHRARKVKKVKKAKDDEGDDKK